jgi:pimeloyl-ACP methyl ester carboxylesterase
MATFLLVHGAMGGAWCWEPVIPGLQEAGHRAHAIDLPSHGADVTPVTDVTLYSYADAVCDALGDDGEPVLLTGHSMGGMVITQASTQRPDRIAGLVYVAAFLPQAGQSLLDITQLPEAAGDAVQASLVVDGDPPVATMPAEAAPQAVYHCCTEEQVAWALPLRSPQPVIPFTQPFTPGDGAQAASALPRAYVTCLQDRAIKPALQHRMYTAASCDPVIEIDTDHSPWLSRTDELVAALDRIARELS